MPGMWDGIYGFLNTSPNTKIKYRQVSLKPRKEERLLEIC